MSGHAAPFFCPYCGEENIRPWGEQPSLYRCGDCLRAWTLKLAGTTTPESGAPEPAAPEPPTAAGEIRKGAVK